MHFIAYFAMRLYFRFIRSLIIDFIIDGAISMAGDIAFGLLGFLW